jgi:hypothetical protein
MTTGLPARDREGEFAFLHDLVQSIGGACLAVETLQLLVSPEHHDPQFRRALDRLAAQLEQARALIRQRALTIQHGPADAA